MADQQVNITLNAVDNTKKALTDLQNNLKGVNKQTEETSTSFFTLKNAIVGVFTSAVVKQIVDVTKSFQDLRNNLSVALGSIEKGNQTFQYLTDFSKQSKFSVEDLTKSFLILYQNGVEPTDRLLNTFAKTAGNATNKLDALNDLTRLFAKGAQGGFNIMALNQLVLNGIPAFEILREELGLDEKSLVRLANTADGAKLILDNLLVGLEKRANSSVQPVRDVSDALNQLAKETKNALFTLGDSPQLVSFIDLLSQLLINLQPLFSLLGLFIEQGLKGLNLALEIVNPVLRLMGDIIGDLINPIKKVVEFIDQYFIKAINKITGAIDFLKNSYISLKNKIFGEELTLKITPETTQAKLNTEMPKPAELSGLQKTIQAMQVATFDLKAQFKEIYSTIAQGLVAGIKDVSKAIAESIVLGKSLQASFADIARNLLVKIIAGLIEEQLAKLALLALDEIAVLLGLKRLSIEKQITAEKRKQAKEGSGDTQGNAEEMVKKQLTNIFEELWNQVKNIFSDIFSSVTDIFSSIGDFANSVFGDISNNVGTILDSLGSSIGDVFSNIGGSLGDILGSVGNFFGGSGGGGGGFDFDLGTIIDIGSAIFGFAEGGDVKGGVPITVGERGRELFIPNTDGKIVPNHDLMGQTNISFTINATDVKGVQELLINNRATITNLINQALNQRGKANLV